MKDKIALLLIHWAMKLTTWGDTYDYLERAANIQRKGIESNEDEWWV